ncbi:transporter, partial [bacterium]|nr:transporter [bacterium]
MNEKGKGIRLILALGLVFALSVTVSQAQNDVKNVHLFQSYFFDTPISAQPYGEAGLQYDSYDFANIITIGARGGYPINEKMEIQATLGYIKWSPDEGDGVSGISDLTLYGRYLINQKNTTSISAGGMVSLPIGSSDIGEGNLNFGGYGAVRHALDNGMVIAGNVGLIFYETTTFETTPIEIDPVTFEI